MSAAELRIRTDCVGLIGLLNRLMQRRKPVEERVEATVRPVSEILIPSVLPLLRRLSLVRPIPNHPRTNLVAHARVGLRGPSVRELLAGAGHALEDVDFGGAPANAGEETEVGDL